MQKEQPSLLRGVLTFYLRLLVIGLLVSALGAGVWSGYLMYRGIAVTPVRMSNGLFLLSMLCFGWTFLLFSMKWHALGADDTFRSSPNMPQFRHRVELQEGRVRFAWYVGSTGLIALALAILLGFK